MKKEEIIEKVKRLLFEESRHLSRQEYYDLLDEIGSDIDLTLDRFNAEDEKEMDLDE